MYMELVMTLISFQRTKGSLEQHMSMKQVLRSQMACGFTSTWRTSLMPNLSPEQSAVIDLARDTQDSLLVYSCAGSGKTTVLEATVPELRGTTAGVAFNHRVAKEMDSRCAAECRTINSFGHRAWSRHIGRGLKVNQSKLYEISNSLKDEIPFVIRAPAYRLAQLGKMRGIVPDEAPTPPHILVPDLDETWHDMIEAYDLDYEIPKHMDRDEFFDEVLSATRQLLTISIREAWEGNIDFDDQIYCTATYRAPIQRYFNVLVDEAQDMSPIQLELVRRMAGRKIGAGDKHQAIYGWRGALYTSMDTFSELFDAKPMPLTVSFRCPRAVVEYARTFVDHIEAHPDAPEGTVNIYPDWNLGTLQPGDTVLCRNNAPIIRLAMKMLRDGRGANVIGRDIGKNLIRFARTFEAQDITSFITSVENYEKLKRAEFIERNKRYRIEALEDRCQSLMAVAEGCEKLPEFYHRMESLFSDKTNLVSFSTIHKAKGLEWNRVFFYLPELLGKYAKTAEQQQQELNLGYVAATRAKMELNIIA